ncbi:MAG: hypothetical protein J7K53_08085 [Bacteroidales bacterium]|nr:hypothetical protein [Bacteroidales bacterium]
MAELSENQEKYKSAQINNALGVFLLIFGIIVIIAVPFSDNFVDKMANLVAGLIVTGIGGGMTWTARRKIKRLKQKDDFIP